MIYVDYRDKDGIQTKEFTDCYMAKRFILSLKRRMGVLLIGWRCDDAEDNEFLWGNV